jgi:hypothetical protein
MEFLFHQYNQAGGHDVQLEVYCTHMRNVGVVTDHVLEDVAQVLSNWTANVVIEVSENSSIQELLERFLIVLDMSNVVEKTFLEQRQSFDRQEMR